ncbi:MAG: putative nucleotide-diphospho-sugar transferase [Nibricoccus sp.]
MDKTAHFCTYFDSKYICHGLALYRSLERMRVDFFLWVLCLDAKAYDVLNELKLPSMGLVRLEDFEAGDKELLQAKGNRSKIEYYWTCTPSWLLYVFRKQPDLTTLVYLDSDIMFFNPPQPIFEALGDDSILIVPHDFHAGKEDNTGRFNVGVMAFRRDSNSFACLQWWRERCNEWCYHRNEDGKCGDQGYLDQFPTLFKQVAISDFPCINAGPWNIGKYELSANSEGQPTVAGVPLVCFHYHSLRFFGKRSAHLWVTRGVWTTALKNAVMRPYLEQLLLNEAELLLKFEGLGLPRIPFPWRTVFSNVKHWRLFDGFTRARRTLKPSPSTETSGTSNPRP